MYVLDVSKHQKTFSPVIAAARGVSACIIRLAYAGSQDQLAMSWAPAIKSAGMKLGGYGFGTWHYQSMCGGDVNTAREIMRKQVNTWIQLAKQAGINWWLAIDQEREDGESMGLGMEDNTKLLNEAATMIKEAGFEPVIYCSAAWDYDNIHTAHLEPWLMYWFANYGRSIGDPIIKDKDFPYVKLEMLPNGKYKNWMMDCFNSGRMVGWQYGSTAWGSVYGVGSQNVDRSIFWKDPDGTGIITLHKVHTGPMSQGDLDSVKALLEDRKISYEVE